MNLRTLTTEGRNPATMNLDAMTPLEIVTAMNREDAAVPRAIEAVLPQIAQAVEVVAERLARGGRLIYAGAGTSGRLGALDASECPPTFGASPQMVQFLIAGGERALTHAVEGSEDSAEQGRADLAARNVTPDDVVVGLAASGRTPYTIGVIEEARKRGAATIAIACNQGSALGKAAELAIEVIVGPEALTGSSRLKAGTAQKLICNMLTTGAMTRLGYVYGNLMINVQLTNHKLQERGISIVETLAQVTRERAIEALAEAGNSVRLAIVMLETGLARSEAEARLQRAHGHARHAIEGGC